jgi:hypothetical protein
MSYKIGTPVIVTHEEVNHVAIILDKFIVNKSTMYDILFENRSAMTMVNTAKSKKTYINKELTEKLCESGAIVPTMTYADLFERNQLPIVRA